MTPERKLKAENILFITGIGLVYGLLYNYLFYPHSLTEFLEAGSISIILGLLVGLLEEFILKRTFHQRSFLVASLIRSGIYSVLISTVLCLVLSIETSLMEQVSYWEAVMLYLFSPLFRRDFLFSLAFIILMLFSLQVLLLVGRANFFRLILGLYHRPREITRIFMFVDLNNSTSIAEKLSNKAYSSFIKDYFYDISDAILLYGGEVYQYAGDEVIVMWSTRSQKPYCIQCFFKMEEIINNQRDLYQTKYGVIPEFKAGIHGGQAVVTSVGKQKKEIVYHGDVLNTASRIVGKCHELGQKLLFSEDLLNYLDLDGYFYLEEKSDIELRGKIDKLRVYTVKPCR